MATNTTNKKHRAAKYTTAKLKVFITTLKEHVRIQERLINCKSTYISSLEMWLKYRDLRVEELELLVADKEKEIFNLGAIIDAERKRFEEVQEKMEWVLPH